MCRLRDQVRSNEPAIFLQIKTLYLTLCLLGNFSCLSSTDFFSKSTFSKSSLVYQAVWIQITPEVLERSQVVG